ncbi:hypothetical protein KUM39_14565 [Streptomyces sp. J2-1]|uniref:hypothetical protein n=1 Tax=Streptomyces corallincola TaxID=2851888 RepID=UPI001C38C6DF|nr:hypothetical protein [Streptomyces corallincola]MBV2355578.1 hypothetical protein [Streptomyces corallincola]
MAGSRGARRAATAAALCALLAPVLAGCGGRAAADPARGEVQRLLDRRSAALLRHDEHAYGDTGTRTGYARLHALPLVSWTYRITALRLDGSDATADADLGYRISGYDSAPIDARRTLTLARTANGGWYVTADRPASGAGQQLWDQGTVTAVRGSHSLVLGAGRPAAELRAYARLADRAVPAVSREWGSRWPRRVVVLVPATLQDMARLLGAPASDYRGIAAVTTGEAGGSGRTPADRVVVNPEAYALLGDVGKQVVLTHETTHVATRADTGPATPLWLSEGYADWTGYLATGRTPTEVAPELARAVHDDREPETLPADRDFRFSSDPVKLAQAYESGWLACRMIADRWGADRLGAFYRAVGTHPRRTGAVEDALHSVLDTDQRAFTAQWRAYVREQLG